MNNEQTKKFDEIQERVLPTIKDLINKKLAKADKTPIYDFIFCSINTLEPDFNNEFNEQFRNDLANNVLLETLNKNYNPEIVNYAKFIMENAESLLGEWRYGITYLFVELVPNQTPKEFNEFLIGNTIGDKYLAEIIYDDTYDELSNLVKFPDDSWETGMKVYAEYLNKLCVAMSMFKDEKYINPTWIDFMVEQIKEKDEIDAGLAKSLKDYFKMLDLSQRFKETDWQEWQLKTLAKFGVLKIMYITTT